MDIKNVAIIAHVDHGKTTLVDAILKQTHTFRSNQKEMQQTLIMDSNDLEREKGITILSKNTAVAYKGTKINIIDTPGHSDFGGEVERVLNMASGALLLVDAAEGPLPQTKFVLKKALEAHLKIILVINKIDKRDARPQEVAREVENLFLEVASHDHHLHFTTIYAVGRTGRAYLEVPTNMDQEADLTPLFETIIKEIPNAHVNEDKPFQMLISTLDYDNYVGRLCIGRVTQGVLKKDSMIALVSDNKKLGTYKAQKLYVSEGLVRREVGEVVAGDIAAIAGIPELTIGQTVTDPASPVSLPAISIEEPTLKIALGPNTSPFAGKEGKFTTSRQLKERLMKEKETNLGLRIEEGEGGVDFTIHGRGELHLAILIETMRREGYEMQVSKPQVIYKDVDGVASEPYEEVTVDVPQKYFGEVSQEFGTRKGDLLNMHTDHNDNTRIVYKISTQNLIGIRNELMTKTRGTAVLNNYLLGYEAKGPKVEASRAGALIASQNGVTNSYGLANAQSRGTLFVGVGVPVYEGMVVGIGTRDQDIAVNVCRTKQLTNNRSSGEGTSVQVEPPSPLSLEQAIDFINEDELLEVTPENVRARKKYLTEVERKRDSRRQQSI